MKEVNLILLPHQDDETFIFAFINQISKTDALNQFVFLTQSPNTDIGIRRNSESQNYLNFLGIDYKNIFFLGDDLKVVDSELIFKLDSVLQKLLTLLEGEKRVHIYAPAYEGGHIDHDATFLIAYRLSQKLNTTLILYPTYNGISTSGKFFRVMKAPNLYQEFKTIYLSFRHLFLFLLAPFFFLSQWKSWVGIYPEYAFRLFLTRKNIVFSLQNVEIDKKFFLNVLNQSVPLYERWGLFNLNQFLELAHQFLKKEDR